MRYSSPTLVLLVIGAIAATLAAAQQSTVTLSGKVSGASGNHPLYVALWDESDFLNKPVQQVRMEPHSDTSFQFEVPRGYWAISAYEDTNENGKLDMGMFGPKEPSGFWRPFHGWHKPRFPEVSSKIDKDTRDANIELHR